MRQSAFTTSVTQTASSYLESNYDIRTGHCRPVWSIVYSQFKRIWEMGTKV